MAPAALAAAALALPLAVSAALRQPLLRVADNAAMAAASVAVGAPEGQAPPEVATTLQDMNDVMLNTRNLFAQSVDRLNGDGERLRQEFQAQSAHVSDLELEKASLQAQVVREKQKLSQELESFKQKMIAKLTELQANNRRLEETNMQLSSTNNRCTSELEDEKAKKETLMKKLNGMASMFNNQQYAVRQIIEQQQQRVSEEVSSDMKDAAAAAATVPSLATEPAYQAPPLVVPPVDVAVAAPGQAFPPLSAPAAPVVPASLEVPTLSAAAPDFSMAPPASAVAAPPARGQPPPRPVPTVAAAPAKAATSKAAQPSAGAALPAHAQPTPRHTAATATATPAGRAATKTTPAKASTTHELSDDEQLKMLHSEVAKLEQSVGKEDGGDELLSSDEEGAALGAL